MRVTRMRVARGRCTVHACMVASTGCTQHAHRTSPKARPAVSPKWLYERSTRVSEVVLRSACVVHMHSACAGQGTHGTGTAVPPGGRQASDGARTALERPRRRLVVPTLHTSHSGVAARSSSLFPLSEISASVEFTCEHRHVTCTCHTQTTCVCSASVHSRARPAGQLAGRCAGVRVARRQARRGGVPASGDTTLSRRAGQCGCPKGRAT